MTDKQCERCGEVNPAEIHTCTPKQEPLAQMKEMLEVQGRDGTWNYDPYSHGMFNGMELVVALAEGRDPVFREAPEKWIYTIPPQPDAVINGMPAYEGPLSKSQRLAQPEPEPVAWMHNFIDEVVIAHRPADLDRHPDRWTALYKDPTPCQTCEALARTVMMDQVSYDIPPRHREPPTQDLSAPLTVNGVPMYPQREWQGLTDEEIYLATNHIDRNERGWAIQFARAIEAKLKEKNHG